MAYVHSILQPGEAIKMIGRLHWIIYWRAVVLLAAGAKIVVYAQKTSPETEKLLETVGWVFIAVGAVQFLVTMVQRSITELSVTTQRIIYKHGFIRRRTVEMALDKVETVDVDQSIMGRLLGYGTIQVRGTGQGIEGLARVQSPIRLRTAITTS